MKSKSKILKSVFCFLQIAAISLGTVSATFAWFINRRTAVVTAEGFQVVLPEAQKVEFYRQKYNFIDSNKNYSGFEKEKLSENEKKEFEKIDLGESNQFDESTEKLWPNHQLCYAMVFTPIRDGTFTFSLSSYVSIASKDKLLDNGNGLSLSFAIDLFVQSYEYKEDFSTATAFFSTQGTEGNPDRFQVGESSSTIDPYTFQADKKNKYVLYFSLLFSNDPSTYYREVTKDDKTYYTKDSTSPSQSNCYEGLSFQADKFTLTAPEAL